VSNGIIGKIQNEKNLEVSGCGVINILTRILIGGSKKNQEKVSADSWNPSTNSNRGLPRIQIQSFTSA
jgi:hypothetical protein